LDDMTHESLRKRFFHLHTTAERSQVNDGNDVYATLELDEPSDVDATTLKEVLWLLLLTGYGGLVLEPVYYPEHSEEHVFRRIGCFLKDRDKTVPEIFEGCHLRSVILI
jgi:hypothetical protein